MCIYYGKIDLQEIANMHILYMLLLIHNQDKVSRIQELSKNTSSTSKCYKQKQL